MPIHLQFTLSFNDYRNAMRLHARRTWWRRIGQFITFVVYPIAGLIFIVFAFSIARDPASGGNTIVVATPGIFLAGLPLYYRYRLKSCYRRTRIDDGSVTLDLSDEGIHSESSNTKTDIAWNAVRSFTENKHLFMLYLAPAKFIAIPKHICSAQQIDELRGLFQRHIQPKAQ
ncbi:MAG TPA: YcxB family protein [Terracidiphilus sp.]|nr:YcxB family protein [Terracidiphilus sp.]